MNNKITWHDVKVYGAGMLTGIAIFWGAIQYNIYKTIQENKIPEIETRIDNFGAKIKNLTRWNQKKQNSETGNEIILYNLKDSSIAIRAKYFNGNANTIEIKKIEKNKIVSVRKLDSIYFAIKEKAEQIKWLENYKKNIENYRNQHRIQCDTLIRNKWGDKFNVSDLTGDGTYDRILYIGNYPGVVEDIRATRDSTKFYKTLNRLMNQK